MESERAHERYMQRCLDLARLGAGRVSPNPMVGAVLVHGDRVLGEGFHSRYGEAHAEVQAIASVSQTDRPLIPGSTLYVSLEPCCVYGRTPPCTNMILREGIRKVVISVRDSSPEVNGRGVEILRAAGVEVIEGVLAAEGRDLFAVRHRFIRDHRPYITLKFARTEEGFMAPYPLARQAISSPLAQRLVHRWRSEHDAILVGYRTALTDDPALTNRHYYGRSPLRIVWDPRLELPSGLKLLDGDQPTLVVHEDAYAPKAALLERGVSCLAVSPGNEGLLQLMHHLAGRKLSSLLVEGGAGLFRRFLEAGLWDEGRVLVGRAFIRDGLPAPHFPVEPLRFRQLGPDRLLWYFRSPPGER